MGEGDVQQPMRAEKKKGSPASSFIKILSISPAIIAKGIALGIILGNITSYSNWLYFFKSMDPASNFLLVGILAEAGIVLAKLMAYRDLNRLAYHSLSPGKLKPQNEKKSRIRSILTSAGAFLADNRKLFVPTRADFIFLLIVVLLGSTYYYMPALASAITDHYEKSGYYESFGPICTGGADDAARMKSIINWSNAHFTSMYKGAGDWPIFPAGQYFLMGCISPPAVTIRAADEKEPLKTEYEWTMITRAGNCGENSIMMLGLADLSGIPVRRVSLQGEDHVFNEAFIDGRWIVIDPLNPFNRGYNIPPRFYEDGWKYHVSYAYARYPNDTIEDVTPRYTDVGYAAVAVRDERGKPVSNATVRAYSNNRMDLPPAALPIFTNLTAKTDANGTVRLRIGDGSYTITAANSERFGMKKTSLKPNETISVELVMTPKEPVNYLVDLLNKSDIFTILAGILDAIAMAYMVLVLMKFYNSRVLWAGVLMFLGIFLAYLLITLMRLILVF